MHWVVLFFKLVWGVVVGILAALKLWIVLPIAAVLVVLRWRRAGMLAWALAWLVGLYVGLSFAFKVPVPGSVVKLYMGIATLAISAYIGSSRERWDEFSRPILRLILEPNRRLMLAAVVVAIPVLVSLNVYRSMSVPLEAPSFGRSIHPAPPDSVTVHEREFSLITSRNPYRELAHSDPQAFQAHVSNGRRVYFQNCVYCHGDNAGGNGMYAHGLNPIPTNFTDGGFLPILEETYVFWRIAKGGPGLPEEGGPWDSAMPAWESFLTEEEMWDVIVFLYDYTGWKPRAKEEH